MSAPQIPEAAVEAALAVSPIIWWRTSVHTPLGRLEQPVTEVKPDETASRKMIERQLAAALPHLHRAWLEGLIAKAEAEAEHERSRDLEKRIAGYRAGSAVDWLRAELAEGGDKS